MQVAAAAATCIAARDLPTLHACAAHLAARLRATTTDSPPATMLPFPPSQGDLLGAQPRSPFHTLRANPPHPAGGSPPPPHVPLVQLKLQLCVRKVIFAVLDEELPEGSLPPPGRAASHGGTALPPGGPAASCGDAAAGECASGEPSDVSEPQLASSATPAVAVSGQMHGAPPSTASA